MKMNTNTCVEKGVIILIPNNNKVVMGHENFRRYEKVVYSAYILMS